MVVVVVVAPQDAAEIVMDGTDTPLLPHVAPCLQPVDVPVVGAVEALEAGIQAAEVWSTTSSSKKT